MTKEKILSFDSEAKEFVEMVSRRGNEIQRKIADSVLKFGNVTEKQAYALSLYREQDNSASPTFVSLESIDAKLNIILNRLK